MQSLRHLNQNVVGTRLGCVQGMFGMRSGCVRDMFRMCSQRVQHMLRDVTCSAHIQDLYVRLVWNMFGTLSGCDWDAFRICSGHVLDLFGTSSGQPGFGCFERGFLNVTKNFQLLPLLLPDIPNSCLRCRERLSATSQTVVRDVAYRVWSFVTSHVAVCDVTHGCLRRHFASER